MRGAPLVGGADVYLLKEVFIDAIALAAGDAEAWMDSASNLYPVLSLERLPFQICLRPRTDLGRAPLANVGGRLGFRGIADVVEGLGIQQARVTLPALHWDWGGP